MCVDRLRSPQSLTGVSSWGLTQLSTSCNSNYFGYI
ncbi:methionine aminopeptidase, partial [Yersinia pseudotuberculosis]